MSIKATLFIFLKIFLLNFLSWNFCDGKVPQKNYWDSRAKFFSDERSMEVGMNVGFEINERLANKQLMNAKNAEIDEGFRDPSKFLPAQNFFKAKDEIKKSRVFKILQSLPKGATLHVHDMSLTSFDYLYNNITFRPNLYVCENGSSLQLHFFDKPDASCDWQLLRDVRQKDDSINERIIRRMSLETEDPDEDYPDVDAVWKKFGEIFEFLGPMLTYKKVYEEHFYQGLRESLEDGVIYVEMRSILPELYDLEGTRYGPLEVAKMYKEVAERFAREHENFAGMKLIYAPIRKCSLEDLDGYIEVANQLKREMPDFVAGFDLVGQEDKGEPLKQFAEKLLDLDKGVSVFFHAGETNWFGLDTDENLVDAVMLGTRRIGHGYAITKHPKVMKYAREHEIAIEVNPISNQVLGLVKDLRNHPAAVLLADDYPVVICNDDPGLWGSRALTYDFYEAFMALMSRHADLRALKKLAINSITYSSMSKPEKAKAFRIWNAQWEIFVASLASNSI